MSRQPWQAAPWSVWHATGREIASWYLDHHYDAALAAQQAFAVEWA